ncbi:hypothetical protein SAMN05216571_104233 [Onishia taeanensis]|jgi:hypothetical protein|uniref:Curli assembly protein CsgC n=2 Tax=Onishia taeanensis TaxID=284577 RepID=A0A1G7RFF2_9GAMM|nr:hypothetical protein SAMN05216571_104233 [Halomonas taeanensis]
MMPHMTEWTIRRSRTLSKALIAGIITLSVSPSLMAQQVFTQLNCRVVIERDGETVRATSVIEANKPTRADYVLRALKIDAAGSGTSEQSGSISLLPGESATTAQTIHRLAKTGWLEFHLRVTERLTGTSCEAKEIVSPM